MAYIDPLVQINIAHISHCQPIISTTYFEQLDMHSPYWGCFYLKFQMFRICCWADYILTFLQYTKIQFKQWNLKIFAFQEL